MQLEAFPVVAHMSTMICLIWTMLPTRVDTVLPPVIAAVIHVEDSVVVMFAGVIAMSRCLSSVDPGDDSSCAADARFRLARLEDLFRRGIV